MKDFMQLKFLAGMGKQEKILYNAGLEVYFMVIWKKGIHKIF